MKVPEQFKGDYIVMVYQEAMGNFYVTIRLKPKVDREIIKDLKGREEMGDTCLATFRKCNTDFYVKAHSFIYRLDPESRPERIELSDILATS